MKQLTRGAIAFLGQDLPLVKAGISKLENMVGGKRLPRKVIESQPCDRLRKEIVEDDVGERLGKAVPIGKLIADATRNRGFQGQTVGCFDGKDRLHFLNRDKLSRLS